MQQWVGLLDCNNFFVSCERLFRPDLQGKPVLVLSSNDGCVVARSQEIKDKGIVMGVPLFQIKDTLKDIGAVTFSSHFALYRDISRRVFETMRKEIDTVEQYSVDEAFFTIQGESEEVLAKVRQLKDRVESEVGIPVSVGVALSKTQAKYASTVAKRTGGIYVMSESQWQDQVPHVALSSIWGIGKRLSESYRSHSLTTVADLLRLERRQVRGLFGVVGERLWQELQGIPTISVERRREQQKSILHSRSFKATVNDISVLKDAVAYHLREAATDLRSMGLKASALQVTLGTSRHGDFFLQGGSANVVFAAPSDDSFEFLKAAMELVERLYRSDVPYKKAGILLTDFTSTSIEQLGMFDTVDTRKTASLMPVIDALNRDIGRDSVVLGSRLKVSQWQSSKELKSPSYTTSWSEIKTVKA
jgi:DNA polymerase V